MESTSPLPPVAFKNQCAILHDNILYVYQPDAFQILELHQGANWTVAENGVSVTGAVCVKGGTDGDSTKPALYVVGGTTNSTTTNYTGLQRYSITDKTWTTIIPLSAVTSQRLYHGATYLNASSALLVYGGSQSGSTSPSTETFLMLMYPPYRIQSYASTAPPVVNPTVLAWSDSQALMVGGSTTNQKVYTFHPDPGWVDLGVALASPLPDRSVAQSSLAVLDDGSKVLFTYDTSQSPNTVRRTVLANAGGLAAGYNQQVGAASTASAASSSTTAASRLFKRATYLNNYPTYNSSSAPSTTRTNYALALGQNDFTGIVGGDSNSTIEFFNMYQNSWEPASDFVGVQQPLVSSSTTSSSSATSSSTSTASRTASVTPAASRTPAAVATSNSSNGLAILGGVLGGVCGLAAILIVLLLYLRHVRKRKRAPLVQEQKQYTNDKPSFEEPGLGPLSRQAEPMGRSPVPSAVVEDRDSVAMFGARSERASDNSLAGAPKHHLGIHSNGSGIGFGFKREKSPLQISKPMMPDLGDYQPRPSIELGKATPVIPTLAVDTGLVTALPDPIDKPKTDQRKTDEGWAKYFSAEKEVDKRDTTLTNTTSMTQISIPTRSGRGGFWPGSGVPEASTRAPAKNTLRDSEGRRLTAHKVLTSSPNLTNGASDMRTRTMSTAEGLEAKISSADSISTDATDDDDYEDEHMTHYSSGVPESIHDNSWTPVGNTWSGPAQRPIQRPAVQVGAHDFPPPANASHTIAELDSSESSLPIFPMPATNVRRIQPGAPPQSQTQPQPYPQPPSQMQLQAQAQPQAGLSHGPSFAPAARNSAASSMYGSRIASEDYFGRSIHLATTLTPQAEAPHHERKPSQPAAGPTDPSDMSWINLGTPATGPAAPPVQRPQQHPDPQYPNQ